MAVWRKFLSDGGLTFVQRKVKPGSVNTYRFRVTNSKSMNIWIGLEHEEPKYEWWFWLKDGWKFESKDNEWVEYTSGRVQNGDVITMIVDGEHATFKVNDVDLGVAFTDQKLLNNWVFPCIFIVDVPDQV